MLSGELQSQIDKLWEEFWTGGITNPLTVIEQITFLMFARMLDINETRNEKREKRTKKPFKHIFSEEQQALRWSHFKQLGAEDMLPTVRDKVFPHFKTIGELETKEGTQKASFNEYFKDAQLMIQKESLLVSAVNMVDALPLNEGDVKGNLYEYLLSKLTTAGINGQFRTPRHIIQLMVKLLDPKPTETIVDPACGTGGFLVEGMEYLQKNYVDDDGIYADEYEDNREHINKKMFNGFDFDATMLRVASMNLLLHGVEAPNIHYQDTLSNSFPENFPNAANNGFDIVLANPPFKGSLDFDDVHPSLLRKVKTKKTELLFVALILQMLKLGGRCAMIVPVGVVETEGKAQTKLRREIIENNQLEAVIALPHWVFKPYASVATCILVLIKGGNTGNVLFYRLENDGFSDDALKKPIKGSEIEQLKNLYRVKDTEAYKPLIKKHILVSKKEIVVNEYDLCPNVYLRDYEYPQQWNLVNLGCIFDISKGKGNASEAKHNGKFPFVTTALKVKSLDSFSFDGDAICIPLVSATGHGHASIKNIHFASGKFEAASIVAVLQPKLDQSELFSILYVYYYLLMRKDDVLVPYMRGSANVSLSISRLKKIKVPLPKLKEQEKLIIQLQKMENNIKEKSEKLESLKSKFESEKKIFMAKV